jgi:ADP-heptose:LPS heptosyltransferase
MRILLLNKVHIGDALFTTPAISALRAAVPGALIVNAVTPAVAPLFAANPDVSENWLRPTRGAGSVAAFVRRIRRARFDAVIASSGNSGQYAFYTVISGARRRIGLEHRTFGRFFTDVVSVGGSAHHHALDHLRQAALLAPVHGEPPMSLFATPEGVVEWSETRVRLPDLAAGRIVGLNPGASVERKRWGAARWGALSDRMHAMGLQPLLFGGPGDADLARDIQRHAARPLPSAQGRLGLAGLTAALSDCDVFVSGDTGPLHMAVAMGVPVVALHGPTHPLRTGPYHARNAVILHHPETTLPEGVFGRMEAISVDEAAEAVSRLAGAAARRDIRAPAPSA